MQPSSLAAEVVIQRPGQETEHGPYSLQQAAEAIARGTFARADDARLRGERRWSKLGVILDDHGVPIPAVAPRIILQESSLFPAQPPPLHPLVASVLALGFRQLFLFFVKVLAAWSLATFVITLAVFTAFGALTLAGLAFGVSFSGILRMLGLR